MEKVNIDQFITNDELSAAVDNDLSRNPFKVAANLLMDAISDWPTENVEDPKDLVAELQREVNDRLTYGNIFKYNQKLSFEKDAWKMEALVSVLELFDFEQAKFNSSIELEDIISQITLHYKK